MINFTRNFTSYFRLNVEHGIGKMKLDAWKGRKGCKTLELIEAKTEYYLKSNEGRRQITDSARELVNVRKARSSQAYLDRWERFCHGVEYFCCVATCPDGKGGRYANRQDLQRHIQEFHSSEYVELDSFLDTCKRLPDETTPDETITEGTTP